MCGLPNYWHHLFFFGINCKLTKTAQTLSYISMHALIGLSYKLILSRMYGPYDREEGIFASGTVRYRCRIDCGIFFPLFATGARLVTGSVRKDSLLRRYWCKIGGCSVRKEYSLWRYRCKIGDCFSEEGIFTLALLVQDWWQVQSWIICHRLFGTPGNTASPYNFS